MVVSSQIDREVRGPPVASDAVRSRLRIGSRFLVVSHVVEQHAVGGAGSVKARVVDDVVDDVLDGAHVPLQSRVPGDLVVGRQIVVEAEGTDELDRAARDFLIFGDSSPSEMMHHCTVTLVVVFPLSQLEAWVLSAPGPPM